MVGMDSFKTVKKEEPSGFNTEVVWSEMGFSSAI